MLADYLLQLRNINKITQVEITRDKLVYIKSGVNSKAKAEILFFFC